jgi:hypothetical protein
MRRLVKIICLAAAVLISAYAQDAPAPAPLPPALRSAINRLATGDRSGPVLELRGTVPAPAATCSVPLLEMHIDHPERFTMRTAPPPSVSDPMPRVLAPAPRCKNE